MKAKLMVAISSIALMGFISIGSVHSEEGKSHDEHHPDSKTMPAKGGDMKMGDMMGKMDMDKMHGMMKECMEMHKDGKICDHKMMESCQKDMSKDECHKMMKESKTKSSKK